MSIDFSSADAVVSELPKVSVVIPTHNRAKDLGRSIRSVLSQSFMDFELIVVDDASTDSTENVVKSFGDPRIRYQKLDNNVGGAEARNIGVGLSGAEIIAFQDSDDEWRPEKLKKMMALLHGDDSLGGAFSSYVKVNGRRCLMMPNISEFDESNIFGSMLKRNVVGTPTLVIRKSVFYEAGGFDSGMKRYQDWDLAIRLSKVSKLKLVLEPLVIANTTEGSISSDVSAHLSALLSIYEKNRADIDQSSKLKAEWLFKRGDALLRCSDSGGRALLFRALMHNPFRYKFVILFVSSLFGCSGYRAVYDYLLRLRG